MAGDHAALELFARNGVGGTSLRMIADELGVTKAAVYHQYNTKDEIIYARGWPYLAGSAFFVAGNDAQGRDMKAFQLLCLILFALIVAPQPGKAASAAEINAKVNAPLRSFEIPVPAN